MLEYSVSVIVMWEDKEYLVVLLDLDDASRLDATSLQELIDLFHFPLFVNEPLD